MIVSRRRDADTAWLSDTLETCRNIYDVAKNVMRLDNYVADIEADAESYTAVFRLSGCKFLDVGLELHSSSNRLDRAWKICQEPVTGVLHDAAAVLCDCWVDSVRQDRR